MTHDIDNPTHLLLNTRCEFYYSGGNVFVPMQKCSVKELATTLDTFGKVEIIVEYHAYGDDKQRKAEEAKYAKRIKGLPPYYNFTGFSPKFIDGHRTGIMMGKLVRCIN